MSDSLEDNWHIQKIEDLFLRFQTSEVGLTTQQAELKIRETGPNLLKEKGKKSKWLMFLLQFKDVMIVTLIVAAIISGIVGDLKDTIVILFIILLNAVVGFVQEYRAEKAMEALKKLALTNTKVFRDRVVKQIPASFLVPGDIVQLEAGDIVPADLRIIELHSLKIDESSLTGEAFPVDKNLKVIGDPKTAIGDRYNLAFKGTVINYGRGKGLVVATGMNTAIGKIAEMLQEEEAVTPLQKRLAHFSKRLSFIVLGICVLIFVSGYFRGEDPIKMLLTSISVAVAAIPEALPAVITIALALGAKNLVKKNALIRKLHAVETLGSVTFICTDKTGTLTQNKMQVVDYFPVGQDQPSGHIPVKVEELLLLAISLNQDTEENKDGDLMGDPTEIALLNYAFEQPSFDSTWEDRFERIHELPFDSDRKLMTTVHELERGFVLVITKGAIESIAEICINHKAITEAVENAESLSANGRRVIAYAYRVIEVELGSLPERLEENLILLGIVGMIDPPREEARKAVADCLKAGIKPVMITGDHPLTAKAIAGELGILTGPSDLMMTGVELGNLKEEDFEKQVHDIRVYARVSPDQKLRIVKALQNKNEFVAMTGDGVNDAPALKRANIGIAMGITGTDVSKESSHMILLDDNFATIVQAVKEGRRIFDNIRRFIKYVLTCNTAEIWTIFLAPLIGLPIPLLPLHILWINLVTDGLPGLALANEKAEKDIMTRPPRHPSESIFSKGLGVHVLWVGLLMGGISLSVQAWAVHIGNAHWQTMVFCTLCFSQMTHVLVIRSDKYSLFQQGLFTNLPLLGAVVLTFVLQLMIVYVPFLQTIFSTQALSLRELMICILSASIILLAVEVEKFFKRINRKSNNIKISG